jgi:hypothetical protein
MVPHLIIVGADKGGVGKTTLSRTLMDFFRAREIDHRSFDSQAPTGVLKRFFPDKTEVVDLTKSDGQMRVFDTLKERPITLVDLQAGLLTPVLKTLSEIGFLDNVKGGKIRISVLHVLGSTQASFDEIKAMAELVEGAKHYLVTNHINDTNFINLSEGMKKIGDGLVDIAKLDEMAAEAVDTAGVSFTDFGANEGNSPVLAGKVRNWLGRVFKQYDSLKLAELY